MTHFKGGDVRFPAISGDGKTIVFEHDFGIWKLDVASREVRPIRLEIAAETQETLTEFREFNSTVDQYDLAPDALVGSIFRMLRQGQRVIFELDGQDRATRLRLGSEVDMGTPSGPPPVEP